MQYLVTVLKTINDNIKVDSVWRAGRGRYIRTYILEVTHLGRIEVMISWMVRNLFENIGCTSCKIEKASLDVPILDRLLTLFTESISNSQPILDASRRR